MLLLVLSQTHFFGYPSLYYFNACFLLITHGLYYGSALFWARLLNFLFYMCSLLFPWTKFWNEIIFMLFWCNNAFCSLLWWYCLFKNENINSLQGRAHYIFKPLFRRWRLIFECAAAVLWSCESNSRLLKMKLSYLFFLANNK